jgi:hypothetical protein
VFLCPASFAGKTTCGRDTGSDSYWPLTALGALRTVFVVQFGEIASVAEAKVLMPAGGTTARTGQFGLFCWRLEQQSRRTTETRLGKSVTSGHRTPSHVAASLSGDGSHSTPERPGHVTPCATLHCDPSSRAENARAQPDTPHRRSENVPRWHTAAPPQWQQHAVRLATNSCDGACLTRPTLVSGATITGCDNFVTHNHQFSQYFAIVLCTLRKVHVNR